MFVRLFSYIQRIGIFDISARLLIVLLPYTTVLTVLGKIRLDIPYLGYYKEILMVILVLSLAWNVVKKNIHIKWGALDIVIAIYVINLIVVSFFHTGIKGIIYGGRYDFSFLIIFWIFYHGFPLLKNGLSYYIRLFLCSTGIMLFLSALLKYPLSEDLLLYIGFSGNPSVWEFSGVPPIFHGIDGANVRRFQGILDNPNTMGAFLILFTGIFAYYFRLLKSWYFFNGGVILVLFILVLYTYSRSAMIGIICGMLFTLIGMIRYIFKHHRKELYIMSIFVAFLTGMIYIQYSDKIGAIINRAGSTQGHLERMTAGIDRALSSPLGQGLGSAGPGYRYVQNLEGLKTQEIEKIDRYYIPESWYIQQFIEGGIVGGVCFIILMGIFFLRLWKKHVFFGGMFLGIAIMNFFLHTFESNTFSLLFFTLIGIILGSEIHGRKSK